MANKDDPKKQPKISNPREDRLKAALKANLGRRKAQAKVRTVAEQQKSSKDDI